MTNPLTDPRGSNGSDQVEVLKRQDDPAATAEVTVIVSLYNYAKFVSACLDSVRTQTLEPLELIVVDDRSADSSADVVREWLDENGGRFRAFQLLRHRANSGLARTRNTAVAHSRSPFVFVLDADNTLYPRCLERLLSALRNCDASFAYCYAERFGDLSELSNYRPWDPRRFPGGNEIDAMVLLRRSEWAKVGGYSTDMPVMGWEDFDLWFKLARAKGWGVLVPEILTRYRVHGTSMLRTVTNPRAEALWSHLRSTYPEFFSDEAPPLSKPLSPG
jgi:glycosyltransferase involved in cell wall biosynthesis